MPQSLSVVGPIIYSERLSGLPMNVRRRVFRHFINEIVKVQLRAVLPQGAPDQENHEEEHLTQKMAAA